MGDYVSSDRTIMNLLGMAHTAQLGGNQEEALGYFNRVLELDPTVSAAWIGKAKAAGWMSTLLNIRFGEMIVAFGHAIATSDDESRASTTAEVVEELNRLVATLYGIARNHLETYASLDNTWPDYLVQVGQMIDALEEARLWDPLNRTTLENVVHLCKDNIEGYSFRNLYQNNAPMLLSITPDYENLLRSRLDQAVAALRQIDGSYVAPAVEKKTADACFVVTATLGDFDHPTVTLLREFRDEWILARPWGRRCVDVYYRWGPHLADIIRDRPGLARISRAVIVEPSARFAARRLGRPPR